MRIPRRTVLRQSAQAAAFVAAASPFGRLLAAPGPRWFKIGACDWSLGKRCNVGAFDVAKRIGLDGVQVDFCTRTDRCLRDRKVQQEYLQAAKRTGLEIASLAIGELNSVPLKNNPTAAQWLAESLDAAKAMNLTLVMPAFFGPGELDMQRTGEIDRVVKALKDVAPKAEELGVAIGLEDYLSAEDNMRILDRVASPALKVYYDVGNSTDKGRNILKEIRLLGKRICQFHFKDAGYMLGHGRIDFKAVRQALDDIQYSGWVNLEAATPHGVAADYAADLKYLRPIFPASA